MDLSGKTIQETYNEVIQEATSKADWYKRKKPLKRIASKIIRAASIVLIGLGGLFPIIKDIDGYDISNWGYYTIAIAGVLLFLDKFFGFSSGWIRYITTEMNIRQKISAFELQWEIETSKAQLCEDQPAGKYNCKTTTQLLTMLKNFLSQIDELVKEETGVWASEFQTNMAELQKLADSKVKSLQPGNVRITITNWAQVKNNYPDVSVMLGMQSEKLLGSETLLTNIAPGTYTIMLVNMPDNKVIETLTVTVNAGQTTDKEITLP